MDELKNMYGASDIPDINDFHADHILGASDADLPSEFNIDNVPSHDQGHTYHCTSYGLTHVMEIMNTIEFQKKVTLDPEEQWKNQLNSPPPAVEGIGDSLQHALKVLIKNGLTGTQADLPIKKFEATGYAYIDRNIIQFKRYISQGFPIYTGRDAHCFCLVGYSEKKQVLIAKDSLSVHPSGTFEIPYKDLLKLFTSYVVYDKKDLAMIFKDVSENSPMADAIKFVKDNGIMQGYGNETDLSERFFRPEQEMTRAEMAVVLQRLYNLLKK